MANEIVQRALTESEAATYLGVSRITLRQGRSEGRRNSRMPPPPYVRLGRRIVYLLTDLDTYLAEHRVEQ
jgi:predicted DNA-binding transcriptional regulator AlpA